MLEGFKQESDIFDFIFKKDRLQYNRGSKRSPLRGPPKTQGLRLLGDMIRFKIYFEGEPTGLAAGLCDESKGE